MPSANVRSIEALAEFSATLSHFQNSAQSSLIMATNELRQVMDWLYERERHCQGEVQRAHEAVVQSQSALAACLASSEYDARSGRTYVPDCSRYRAAVDEAQVWLHQTEAQLQVVHHWLRAVTDASMAYQAQAQSLTRLLTNDVPNATAFLRDKVGDLQTFLTGSVHISSPSTPLSSVRTSSDEVDSLESSLSISITEMTLVDESGFVKFGELSPNSTYTCNGYTYRTDPTGRTNHVNGEIYLEKGTRNLHYQRLVGHQGRSGDQGGHLIGTQFNGSPQGFNMVPQNGTLNNGAWSSMEDEWVEALKKGSSVYVDIMLYYPSATSIRPSMFEVYFTIDGVQHARHFRNRPGG